MDLVSTQDDLRFRLLDLPQEDEDSPEDGDIEAFIPGQTASAGSRSRRFLILLASGVGRSVYRRHANPEADRIIVCK